MAEYRVRYEMRQGSKSASGEKTVKAESDTTAIEIVKGKAQSEKPGYDFILKACERK
ncbi:hypothetical protein HW932_17085 [Allochromatium humboldtianum]|uniref:Uncharacterized protein n=1 Tax=Allochromatium humboldtianum TaxID=504901 RepID=A0A850RAL3_9GAMM|nr:hypothetical protein [Allochromatium humboldtianum]NVZ10974.1 hypothetical protein [Allochromatium humboldtianum]